MQARFDVAIIGAGLAGCLITRGLAQQGLSIALFDKARGVGGRLSRYHSINLGSDELPDHELIDSLKQSWSNSNPINQILKDVLNQADHSLLSMFFQTRIVNAQYLENTWKLQDENLNIYSAKVLICCLPQPQTKTLLDSLALSFNLVNYQCAVTLIVPKITYELQERSWFISQKGPFYKAILKDIPQKWQENSNMYDLVQETFCVRPELVHFWRYGFCHVSQPLKEQFVEQWNVGFCSDWITPGPNLWTVMESAKNLILRLKSL